MSNVFHRVRMQGKFNSRLFIHRSVVNSEILINNNDNTNKMIPTDCEMNVNIFFSWNYIEQIISGSSTCWLRWWLNSYDELREHA